MWFLLGLLFAAQVLSAQQAPSGMRPGQEEVLLEKQFIEALREKVRGDFEEAIQLFNELLRKDKDNHAACFELAKLYEATNQHGKAVEKARRAFDLNPKNIFYGVFCADMLEHDGRYSEAAGVFEALVKQNPGLDSLEYRLAYDYRKMNKPDQAIKMYNQIESRIGVTPEISLEKFALFQQMGKGSKAVAELEALLATYPSDVSNYEALAKFYEKNGQADKVFEVYDRLLKIVPEDPRANLRMAEFYKARGEETKYLQALAKIFPDPTLPIDEKVRALMPYLSAIDQVTDPAKRQLLLDLGKAIATAHPNEGKAHAVYGDLAFNFGLPQIAAEAYQTALKFAPNKIDLWNNYLLCAAALGRWDAVFASSAEMMDLFPNDPAGPYFNGMANIRKGRYADALTVLQDALRMAGANTPLKADIHSMMGSAQARQGNFAKADEAFEKALQLSPDSYVALNEYSWSLLQRGERLDKAAEMSKKANALMPYSPIFQSNYGRILYRQKDFKEAKKWYEKALAQGGDQIAEVLEHYGDVLFRLNQNAEALNYWRKAQEKGPGSEALNNKVATQRLED